MLRRDKKAYLIFFFLVITTGILIFLQLVLQRKTGQRQTPDSGKDARNFILTAINDCYKKEGTNGCYKRLAQDIFARFPANLIFRIFEENESRPEMFTNCHEVMHYIGRDIYRKEGSVPNALGSCSHVCFEGCLHGVTEGFVLEKHLSIGTGNDEQIASEIPTICGKREAYEKTQLFDQCIHGIGHAAMLLTENDVPRALKLCDFLRVVMENELCYSGVFMENSNSSTNKDHPSKYVKANDPFYPCAILEEKYRKMCYELQSFKLIEFIKNDWQKTFTMCSKIDRKYQAVCYKSLGSTQVGFTQDDEVRRKNCDFAPPGYYRDVCVRGVVGALATRYGGDVAKIISFCNIADAINKKACYSQMGMSLMEWHRETGKVADLCSQIPDQSYQKFCKNPQ